MLQCLLTLAALVAIHLLGFAHGTADHVDISPADMYARSLDDSRHVDRLERHKRQSGTSEVREMFVTQCGYYNTEPVAEPSINVKGVDLNNWAAVEKVGYCSTLIKQVSKFICSLSVYNVCKNMR